MHAGMPLRRSITPSLLASFQRSGDRAAVDGFADVQAGDEADGAAGFDAEQDVTREADSPGVGSHRRWRTRT
jgi:hypothetical protein